MLCLVVLVRSRISQPQAWGSTPHLSHRCAYISGGRNSVTSAKLCQFGYWYHTYVAYSMSTWVCTTHFYLSLFRWIFSKINTSSFSHKMAVCVGRTLFPSMASIALPWTNIIENLSKQLHFYFVSKQRGGEKWHEVKNSKNLGYNPSSWLVFTGVSGRFLPLQQISAYVKTCGWCLTFCCNTVTIVIGHEQ